MGRIACLAAALMLLPALASCGEDEGSGSDPAPEREAPTTGGGDDAGSGGGAEDGGEELVPPPCPADLANCAQASGEIIYVERVDPDGDGDAHFVLLSGESITGPGISVIDVKPSLRPSPLPGPGDSLAAAGPVFEGSYGQSQIQALQVRVGD